MGYTRNTQAFLDLLEQPAHTVLAELLVPNTVLVIQQVILSPIYGQVDVSGTPYTTSFARL